MNPSSNQKMSSQNSTKKKKAKKTVFRQPTITQFCNFGETSSSSANTWPPEITMDYKDVTKNITGLFNSLSTGKNWSRAIELLSMFPDQRAGVEEFQKLLHEVLLKSDDPTLRLKILQYARQQLKSFPPRCTKSRQYYISLLFENNKQKILWDFVSDLIRCCLHKWGIGDDEARQFNECKKNCFLLLRFIFDVLKDDHDFAIRQKTSINMGSCKSLVVKMMWPISEPINKTIKCTDLIKNIHDLLRTNVSCSERLEMLEILQELMCMMAEYSIVRTNSSEIDAVRCNVSDFLLQIQEVFSDCKDLINNRNLDSFIGTIRLTWLRILICQSIYCRHNIQPSTQNSATWYTVDLNHPLTLEKIVQDYMKDDVDYSKFVCLTTEYSIDCLSLRLFLDYLSLFKLIELRHSCINLDLNASITNHLKTVFSIQTPSDNDKKLLHEDLELLMQYSERGFQNDACPKEDFLRSFLSSL